jgi:hypothetical protein
VPAPHVGHDPAHRVATPTCRDGVRGLVDEHRDEEQHGVRGGQEVAV